MRLFFFNEINNMLRQNFKAGTSDKYPTLMYPHGSYYYLSNKPEAKVVMVSKFEENGKKNVFSYVKTIGKQFNIVVCDIIIINSVKVISQLNA